MTTHNQSSTVVWTSSAISTTYREFFTTREHLELPGSPLVAPDMSTYFTVAGMQPLLPYLRGQQTPPAPRLTTLQSCLRTVDVADTGKTNRKLTLFHMLGNWSIGDYGKREAIEMAIELLHVFGLDFQRLWITTFGGEPALNLPPDELTRSEWQRQGFPVERIVPLGMEDNFWDLGAQVAGPCGPCTEIF
ncbi:MAG: alanine--tRNA ligase-related protein, partial [Ktedonobacteraceae bacterium]